MSYNRKKLKLNDLLLSTGISKKTKIDFEIIAGKSRIKTKTIYFPVKIVTFATFVKSDFSEFKGSLIVTISENDMKYIKRSFSESIARKKIACFIASDRVELNSRIVDFCNKTQLPLLRVDLSEKILEERLLDIIHILTVESSTIHGSMMDVLGVGILITGKSGIGKSECCLDLVIKGHRLVADDLVKLYKNRQGKVTGLAQQRHTASYMEIRGVGIMEVDRIFGISAIRSEKDLDLSVNLVDYEEWKSYNKPRLTLEDIEKFDLPENSGSFGFQSSGLADEMYDDFFGVKVPKKIIPVAAGRNLANLIEVSARSFLLSLNKY